MKKSNDPKQDNVTTKMTIEFEGQQPTERIIQFEEFEDVLDLKLCQKKILAAYGLPLSYRNKLQLIIPILQGISYLLVPVVGYSGNYALIIGQCLSNHQPIRIQIIAQNLPQKSLIEFDSDGSIDFIEDSSLKASLNFIRPAYHRYYGEDVVQCGYCGKSSQDSTSLKILGPLYGPFDGAYAHLLCGIWCAEVYVSQKKNIFMNISQSVKAAQKKQCISCSRSGAGLICHKCGQEMHYQCAVAINCRFNWSNFKLYCLGCTE